MDYTGQNDQIRLNVQTGPKDEISRNVQMMILAKMTKPSWMSNMAKMSNPVWIIKPARTKLDWISNLIKSSVNSLKTRHLFKVKISLFSLQCPTLPITNIRCLTQESLPASMYTDSLHHDAFSCSVTCIASENALRFILFTKLYGSLSTFT